MLKGLSNVALRDRRIVDDTIPTWLHFFWFQPLREHCHVTPNAARYLQCRSSIFLLSSSSAVNTFVIRDLWKMDGKQVQSPSNRSIPEKLHFLTSGLFSSSLVCCLLALTSQPPLHHQPPHPHPLQSQTLLFASTLAISHQP